MNTVTVGIAVGGLAVVLGTWVEYLSTIPRGTVPARPVGSMALQCVGIVLAVSAIVLDFEGGEALSFAVTAPAVMALMMGSTFFWLLSIRKTPIGDLRVEVGDSLLAFDSITSEGTAFHTDQLAGRRILLKFFRGGW